MKQADERSVGREIGVHRPQQGERRKLAALVDADPQRLALADVQFDPASAFGDDAAAVELPWPPPRAPSATPRSSPARSFAGPAATSWSSWLARPRRLRAASRASS